MGYREDFRLFMVSAMYENGGNTTHRFLDGHPELFVYPFESQLGHARCSDYLSSLCPFKYRYPDFPLGLSASEYYEMIFDEECKTASRARQVSKFRDAGFEFDEAKRKKIFCEILSEQPVTRANIVAAFFEATFSAWTNLSRSGRESAYVGYSPVIAFDSDRIFVDFANAHVIHVVRNPWSGFADTSKRPFPLSIERYAWTWAMMQHHALVFARRYSGRFHIVKFEDLVSSPRDALGQLTKQLGIGWNDALLAPSWNGKPLASVYPWGTIRTPTKEANIAAMNELTANQKAIITSITAIMLPHFGYDRIS